MLKATLEAMLKLSTGVKNVNLIHINFSERITWFTIDFSQQTHVHAMAVRKIKYEYRSSTCVVLIN